MLFHESGFAVKPEKEFSKTLTVVLLAILLQRDFRQEDFQALVKEELDLDLMEGRQPGPLFTEAELDVQPLKVHLQ
ncbi:MAG: hypothetical protein R2784_20845 [Saprospiraceae bacterium]